MDELSQHRTLELWHQSLPVEALIADLPLELRRRAEKRIEKETAKSRGEEIFPKLAEHSGDKAVIKDQLPTIFHNEDTPPGEVQRIVLDAIAAYRATLPTAFSSLLERYELRDAAVKVVGVGSVGTMCLVLLRGRHYFFRQLRDVKVGVLVETFGRPQMAIDERPDVGRFS